MFLNLFNYLHALHPTGRACGFYGKQDKKIWYWLNTYYACGGIAIKNGYIVETAPIYKWMKGETIEYTVSYLKRTNKLKDIIKIND